MSVINDVLKELHNRESRFTPLELAGDGARSAAPLRRSLALPLAILLLLAIIGGWYFQFWWPKNPVSPVASISRDEVADVADLPVPPTAAPVPPAVMPQPAPVEQPAPKIAAAPAQAPVNAIIGLQLQEAADELRMEFVLREHAVAYLKQRDKNGFAYHLGNVESRIVAPTIDGNRWLEQLVIDTNGDGVDIRFVTAPDVLVDTSQARGDDESVWAISLRHMPPVSPVEKPATAPAVAVAAPVVSKVAGTEQKIAPTAKASATKPVSPQPLAEADNGKSPVGDVRLNIRSTGPSAVADGQLQAARKLVDAGRHADAERLLRDLLGGPDDYETRRQLLAIYSARQQHDRAGLLASDSAVRYPEDPLFVTEHARSLFQRAGYVDVIRLLAGERTLDASQQSLLAVSYQRLGRHAEAIRHFRLALGEDRATSRNWVGLAISQEQMAAPGEALDSYEQALALGDLNERLHSFADQRRTSLRRVLN